MSGIFQRYTSDDPCPICGHYATDRDGHCHGGQTDDGAFVRCTRADGSDGAMLDEKCSPPAHVYHREGDGSYRPWTEHLPMQPIHITKPRTEAHSTSTGQHPVNKAEARATRPRPDGTRYFPYGPDQRVKRFDFRRDDGTPDKRIRPEHRNAVGVWVGTNGPEPIQRIYRRDDLTARSDERVYVVEGEGCADVLRAMSALAITWRGGCGQVRQAIPQVVEALRGRDVTLLSDADGTGRSAMRDIAMALRGVAKTVRIVNLYDDESGRDVEDWLHEGGTVERLAALVDAMPLYEPDAATLDMAFPQPSAWDEFRAKRVDLNGAALEGIEAPEHLVEPVVLKRKVHGFAGPPESGKTIILQHIMLLCLQAGLRVAFFDEESGAHETVGRLVAMGATEDNLSRLDYFPFALGGRLDDMAATVIEGAHRERYALVGFDSISKLFTAFKLDENSNSDATRLMATLVTPLTRLCGSAVAFLDHVTKAGENGRYGRGASAKLADVDIQWSVEMTAPVSRTGMGRIVLTKQKDRTASMPGAVRYVAGGDGTGALTVHLEGTAATPPARMNQTDKEVLTALHGEGSAGLRYAEWMGATGKSPSTFKESRRRLLDANLVEQRDDFYRVTDAGIVVCSPETTGPDEAGSGPDSPIRPSDEEGPGRPDSLESGLPGPHPGPATAKKEPHLWPNPPRGITYTPPEARQS